MRLVWQVVTVVGISLAGAGVWYATAQTQDTSAGAARPATGGRPISVEAAAAIRGSVDVTFDAVGSLRANEAVTVTSKISGIIKSIQFEEGQQVKAGQVLVELDDNEAQADVAVAEAERLNARQLLERSVALLPRQAVSQARVDELRAEVSAAEARVRAAQARLQDLTIRAPFSGVVGLRQVSPGALVRPADPVTTVDDISLVKLDFAVPETALDRLRVGTSVQAQSAAYDARSFAGVVGTLDTRIDPVSRTVMVVAELPNPDMQLKPGMFMTVKLVLDNRANVVLVPEQSLVPVGDRQFVFVVRDGKVERRLVDIGVRQGGLVEVRDGLTDGELVVVRGVQKIRDGASVKADVVPIKGPAPAPGTAS